MRMKSFRGLRTNGGFTLVEMMVALLVFGIGLVALAQVLPHGLSTRDRSQRLSMAASLAQEEVERLRGLPYDHADLAAGTHVDPGNPLEGTLSRRWEVLDDNPITDMKRVRVTVALATASADSTVTLVTHLNR